MSETNPFDSMTLYETDVMIDECFGGKPIEDVNPFDFAGGVLYMISKRDNPDIDWESFRRTTPMSAIKEFAQRLNSNEETGNPTNGAIAVNA